MLKLENKDIKTVITAIISYIQRFKQRGERERERDPNQTFKGENVTCEMKIDWIRLRAGQTLKKKRLMKLNMQQ